MAKYGLIRDLPDQRDILFVTPAVGLPDAIDLRAGCPAIYDQGQLGSCVSNAVAAAIEFDLKRQQLQEFQPSRLFIYFNARVAEGTVFSDSGCSIRDGVKVINRLGACAETAWPYDITQFTSRPSLQAYNDAKLTKALSYARVSQFSTQMRACLASGSPFVFGITVYESFESPHTTQTGQVFLPGPKEATLGGHALLAVGYNNATQQIIFRNSWGATWGDQGYGYIPYEYLNNSNLSADFWTIKTVS